jgi:hypothetical protein
MDVHKEKIVIAVARQRRPDEAVEATGDLERAGDDAKCAEEPAMAVCVVWVIDSDRSDSYDLSG